MRMFTGDKAVGMVGSLAEMFLGPSAGAVQRTSSAYSGLLPLRPVHSLGCLVDAGRRQGGAVLMARRPDGLAPEKPYEGEK